MLGINFVKRKMTFGISVPHEDRYAPKGWETAYTEKSGPIRHRSPIRTDRTGVSNILQFRLMNVDVPMSSLVP